MVRWGFTVALVRDLTDAMYSPAHPPYVSHDAGTQLTVAFVEKFWCPTILSQDLLKLRVVPVGLELLEQRLMRRRRGAKIDSAHALCFPWKHAFASEKRVFVLTSFQRTHGGEWR